MFWKQQQIPVEEYLKAGTPEAQLEILLHHRKVSRRLEETIALDDWIRQKRNEIQQKRQEQSTPPTQDVRSNPLKGRINKMELLIISRNYDAARQAWEEILQNSEECIGSEEKQRLKDILDKLYSNEEREAFVQKLLQETKAQQDEIQTLKAENEALQQPRENTRLAAFVLASCYLENEASVLPEVRELIDFFVQQKKKKYPRLNPNHADTIFDIILENAGTCFGPYIKNMEDKNE